MKRLTLNWASASTTSRRVPRDVARTGPLVPTRNIDVPEDDVRQLEGPHAARRGRVRPVGNGKTAIKVSLGKYVSAGPERHRTATAEPDRVCEHASRGWNDRTVAVGDRNGDFVPQCDPINRRQRRVRRDATRTSARTDAEHDDQPGQSLRVGHARVQLGVLGRRAAAVAAARVGGRRLLPPLVRQLHRSPTTCALGAGRLRPFSITAPVDSRLPGGGGYTITGLYDLNTEPGRAGRQLLHARQRLRQTDPALERHGRDGQRAARGGVLLQGGVSTGRHDHRQLRDPRAGAGTSGREPDRSATVTRAALPDAGEVPRLVTGPEDGRAGQRHVPEHSRAADLPRTRSLSNAAVAAVARADLLAGAANVTVNLVSRGRSTAIG